MLIPAVDEPLTLNLATGTEGVTYLLMRHPAEPSILLAIVDDDPRYMKHIMVFATAERRTEIKAEMRTADARGAA